MDLVTLACRLASPGAGEWGCIQDFTHSWGLCPHVGLLDLLIWSFTGFLPDPGTLVSKETPSWPHLELVTLILSACHPDLVTLVLTCGPL